MPVTSPGIMGVLIPNLASMAMIGSEVPRYARGVANGLVKWVPQIKVQTVDVGTAGAGKSAPTPVVVPQPMLYGNIVAGMSANGLAGMLMPAFSTGLANGLVLAFAQMLISTNHVGVGSGGGVAKFLAPPATPAIIQGFQEAGMVGDGPVRKAAALGMALTNTFAILVLPVAIVGPSSPAPGSGTGFGNIV